jgi:hypothetical protein
MTESVQINTRDRYGDLSPLAVLLPQNDDARLMLKSAREWAKAHREATGYITVERPVSGCFYYLVAQGKVRSSSAIQCCPGFFQAWQPSSWRNAKERSMWARGAKDFTGIDFDESRAGL